MARRETRQTLAQTFANRLRYAQQLRGINTEELAREADIGLRVVQKHRAGDHLPSQENLYRYSRVLQFSIPWFLEEDKAA